MAKKVKANSKRSKPGQAGTRTRQQSENKSQVKAQAKPKRALPSTGAPPLVPQEKVMISKAKGRPMLSWVGKRALHAVTVFPGQHVESFTAPDAVKIPLSDEAIWKEWPDKYPRGGLLLHGDNKEVLAHLLASGFRGKVHLVYIDPPFDSGADYVRRVKLRGPSGKLEIEGEGYTLGEQIQYTDIWANDNYLQFMYERLLLLKELLAEDGAIVVHCDWHQGHRIRLILDEVFSEENCRNEIIWHYGQRTESRDKKFDMKHDNLLFYAKSKSMMLNESTVPWSYDEFIQHRHDVVKDEDGREFIWTDGGSGNERYKRFVAEVIAAGKPLDSVWDLPLLNSSDKQRVGFPTQKPDYLLERIVRCLSKPGDVVLDCFIGSGTTADVAQNLGRRWIGCDINKGAIQTTAKRLQDVMTKQVNEAVTGSRQQDLLPDDKLKEASLAQLSFTVWRVNDYDLAVQHNEAVNLACEHIGVTRTVGDGFFDGTWGKKLVKIVPFGHPLSPADLEDVKRELDIRQKESRDVVMVCLGKELSVDSWLSDYNRVRRQGDAPNKIEVIELRTDPKYGKFIEHKPAEARVDIRRVRDKDGEKIVVEIKDFISTSIIERLGTQSGLLTPKITDWRAMVDSVMIDQAFNGKVFNVALADVPERKQDLVEGRYEFPASNGQTTVAVKVTDMLGEEVLVQKEV
jgi:DNA modification methylase